MYDQITPVVKKYDEALNEANKKNYGLSIQLGADGFSFCIYYKQSQKFMGYESVIFKQPVSGDKLASFFVAIQKEHPWLNGEYQSVMVFFEPEKTTLIPNPLFDPDEKELIARFNFTIPDHHNIRHEPVESLDASILYPFPDNLEKILSEIYPGVIIKSHLGAMTEILLISTKNLPVAKRIYVNVRSAYLDLIILEGKKLLFCNSFGYRSKQDFIYFIIFVMEQLNINPEEIELIFSGKIDKKSDLFDIAYKYVRHIDFQPLPDNYSFSYVFNEIPAHMFFGLIHSPLCGL